MTHSLGRLKGPSRLIASVRLEGVSAGDNRSLETLSPSPLSDVPVISQSFVVPFPLRYLSRELGVWVQYLIQCNGMTVYNSSRLGDFLCFHTLSNSQNIEDALESRAQIAYSIP